MLRPVKRQQVTWRMAFAFADPRSCSIASTVGITISSTPRRSASAITSSVTGSDPDAPLPTTRHLHDQGMSSAAVSGVCPYLPRSAFEGPFFRFRIRPLSITTSCS
jgi:hypothetical protein